MPSFHTLAVHAGERMPRPDFTPVATPIYHSAAYIYEELDALDGVFAGTREGPVYARYGNPTLTALEAAVAALEGGEASLSYASGMAAIHGALLGAGARAGTAVVAAQDVYGATYALLNRVLASQGVTVRFVDGTDLAAVAAAVAELKPVAVVAETISNPLLKLADVPRLAEISAWRRRGADRGQHLRIALPLPAAPARRGLLRPQRDQVSGRPR